MFRPVAAITEHHYIFKISILCANAVIVQMVDLQINAPLATFTMGAPLQPHKSTEYPPVAGFKKLSIWQRRKRPPLVSAHPFHRLAKLTGGFVCPPAMH